MSQKIPKRKVVDQNDVEARERPTRSAGKKSGDANEAMLEALPEAARAADTPASFGTETPEQRPEDDENEEGGNESAQLVETGLEDAEDDQARQAERQATQRNRRGR